MGRDEDTAVGEALKYMDRSASSENSGSLRLTRCTGQPNPNRSRMRSVRFSSTS